jgi:aminobenzoyl-glutamate utilization protein B
MMLVDLLTSPALIAEARAYFAEQTKEQKYESLFASSDEPPLNTNLRTMKEYRGAMSKLYFDSTRYKTYLDQLGIDYPTMRR